MERFPESLLAFQRLFSTDEVCTEYLAERRWPNGFVCPKCQGNSVWRLNSRPLWECRGCGRQTSITAGTLMAKTKLPLRVWFWAAYLMSTHSNGLSALQLKGQLGVDYKTAWLLAAKLRRAMVNPDRSKLAGVVEIDQTEIPFRQENPPLGVGGRQGMITVVGAVEIVDRVTGGPPRWAYNKKLLDTKARRIRLQVIPNNLAPTLDAFVLANVEPGSVILTDDYPSYVNLSRRLHARPEDRRTDGRPCRPALGASRLRPAKAVGARRLPRPSPKARPELPRRILLPVQSPPLAPRLL